MSESYNDMLPSKDGKKQKRQFSASKENRRRFAERVLQAVQKGSTINDAILANWEAAGLVQNWQDTRDETIKRLRQTLKTGIEFVCDNHRKEVLDRKWSEYGVPHNAEFIRTQLVPLARSAVENPNTPELRRQTAKVILQVHNTIEEQNAVFRELYPNARNVLESLERPAVTNVYEAVRGGCTKSMADFVGEQMSIDDFLADVSESVESESELEAAE